MKRMVGFALIIIGILVLGTGIYFVVNDSRVSPRDGAASNSSSHSIHLPDAMLPSIGGQAPEEQALESVPPLDRKIEDSAQAIASVKHSDGKATSDYDTNFEVGLEFEKYVVLKFDKQHYALKNWAGDKFVEGRYAETTLQPDLTFELKYSRKRYPFAVECKWRSKPKSDHIKFAEEAQLKRYQQFAVKENIPTFIVLGVGGKPSAPEDVYVFSVDRFSSAVQKLENLAFFKRKTNDDFYFNFKYRFLK